MADYLLNPSMEIAPAAGGRFTLRLPLYGRSTEATAYQINLLGSFREGASVEAVLAAFPFERSATEEFLRRCIQQAVLLERDEDSGEAIFPTRSLPAATLFQCPPFEASRPAAFTFLGVPYDGATTGQPGARFGPGAVRQASGAVRYKLDPLRLEPEGFFDHASGRTVLQGIQLADAGDLLISPGDEVDSVMHRLTEAVRELIDAGSVPLVIGGDHSITYGALRAFRGRKLSVLHLDAHTDLGAYPGDPLHHGTVFVHVLRDLAHVHRLYQAGLRGLGDAGAATSPRIVQLGMDAVRREGIASVLAMLPADEELYLSLDIDAVDPVFAPSTGTPVPGGFFPHELKDLLRAVASQRSIVGMDVVEVAHPSGPADATPHIALEALLTVADGAVEFIRRGMTEPDAGDAALAAPKLASGGAT